METKNKVSMGEVIKGVLIQQFLQTLLGLLVVVAEDEDVLVDDAYELKIYHQNFHTLVSQFGLNRQLAPFQHMIVSSTYCFLYRHIHSRHHLLYVPYAFGALYNHPVEGFVLDSVGASIAFKLSGLTTRGGMLFFSFATLKTGTYMAHPPTTKKSLNSENENNRVETRTNNTINFNHISSKVNGNGNRCTEQDNDHIQSRDKMESNNRGNSPFRYNLRPRKAVSSL
ncbi:1242_t:CDS:2 [Ambispora gerdemannii]|uniref:1242_t:CDS:1 n=1 Tax=Ambispora gerdemannii TaxID=144530 RepID=A0A9N9C4K4_9GLOM|nr:1242_t:CDS:2 [Ambispora gerdemannii]